MNDSRPDIESVFEFYQKRILSAGSGIWQKAECPLLSHEDRNPSASVNTETGKWNCFSCDQHGDVYDIVKENEGLAGFTDAISFCEENFAAGRGDVRQERGRPGLLPRATGHRQGRRNWSPPWKSV